MIKQEFETIVGYEVSEEDYRNIIEPMYMATNLDKFEFAKTINRKRFEVKREKTTEQIDLENQINEKIEMYRVDLEECEKIIEMFKPYEDDEDDFFKKEIKNLEQRVKLDKLHIRELRKVLK